MYGRQKSIVRYVVAVHMHTCVLSTPTNACSVCKCERVGVVHVILRLSKLTTAMRYEHNNGNENSANVSLRRKLTFVCSACKHLSNACAAPLSACCCIYLCIYVSMQCLARTRVVPRHLWQCGNISSLYCCNACLLMTAFICCIDDYFLHHPVQTHTSIRVCVHVWRSVAYANAVTPWLLRFFASFFILSACMYVCVLHACLLLCSLVALSASLKRN